MSSILDERALATVNQAVQVWVEAEKRLQERMRPILEAIQNAHKALAPTYLQMAKVAELLKASYEQDLILRDKLVKDKLFVSPYFGHCLSLPDLRELFILSEKTTLEIYSEFFAEQANVDDLLNYWNSIEHLKRRTPILKKALVAHVSGDYELSIPIFLIHIESILREFIPFRKYEQLKKELKKNQKPKGKDAHESLYTDMFGESLIVDILCDEVFLKIFPSDNKTTDYPNRHTVLHGIDLDYYRSPFNSVKCIVLLDTLTTINKWHFGQDEENIAENS